MANRLAVRSVSFVGFVALLCSASPARADDPAGPRDHHVYFTSPGRDGQVYDLSQIKKVRYLAAGSFRAVLKNKTWVEIDRFVRVVPRDGKAPARRYELWAQDRSARQLRGDIARRYSVRVVSDPDGARRGMAARRAPKATTAADRRQKEIDDLEAAFELSAPPAADPLPATPDPRGDGPTSRGDGSVERWFRIDDAVFDASFPGSSGRCRPSSAASRAR